MREWLVADCRLFGLAVQNWMWVVGLGFLAYVGSLAVLRRRIG